MNNFSHKVFILTEQDDVYHHLLSELDLPDLEITLDAKEAEILLAAPPLAAKHLDSFEQLEWCQSIYAGVDALITPYLRDDYELTNVKGIFGQSIAEYVIGLTIEHFRHFAYYHQQQNNHSWAPLQYQSISDKRVVILGTGSIGSFLATRVQALGMHAIGINRTGIPAKEASFDQTFHINELETALSQADIIVNTLPNTEQTHLLLNQESLNKANGALLFNVGRGNTVCEQGLLDALHSGAITHAYLDVFQHEPLPKEHPFWAHDKITVTPHIAALSNPKQVLEIFAENYQRWRDGFSLNHRIDFDKGY
ncbi:D-2-hydroxyacid dehydrogenase [Vibrio maerlii]|uniref:D-2-hydroxyacid dehydrogenase n=1 Tax=Vibrio maerlii TaxID=2231648 RepID=UPI000E3DD0E3|nr:D-2-hydroxyacid dehydrogenase [Vibrio maerlii]